MITSPEQARDDMFLMADTAITALSAILTYVPEIRWQGVENNNPLPASQLWARVTKLETDEDQKYVSNSVNTRLFNHIGILSVELFGPKTVLTIYDDLQSCATNIRNAFRVKTSPNGVRYSKVRIIEVPNDNLWYKINVIIEYEYDEQGTV